MKKLTLLLVALLAALFAAGAALSPAQTTCPVRGGKIKQDVFTDYQGQRVYFCCPGCEVEFRKHPDKYLEKLQGHGEPVLKRQLVR